MINEFNELLTKQQLIQYSKTVISILFIIITGILTYLILKRTFKSLARKNIISLPIYSFMKSLIRYLILIFILLLSIHKIGINVTSIWATLLTVAGMIAIGFIAVWSVLSNIMCSIFIMTFKPFRLNDHIELIEPTGGSGLKGKVIKFNLMFTILEENKKSIVHVPNNMFFQKSVRKQIK